MFLQITQCFSFISLTTHHLDVLVGVLALVLQLRVGPEQAPGLAHPVLVRDGLHRRVDIQIKT